MTVHCPEYECFESPRETVAPDVLECPTHGPFKVPARAKLPPAEGRPLTTEERFLDFHRAHPEVYDELVKLATKAKKRGRRKWGVKALFEVLRWQREFTDLPSDVEDFKLNNNYTAHYARLIMSREPFLATYFETREKS